MKRRLVRSSTGSWLDGMQYEGRTSAAHHIYCYHHAPEGRQRLLPNEFYGPWVVVGKHRLHFHGLGKFGLPWLRLHAGGACGCTIVIR